MNGKSETTEDLIVDYIRRGRATLNNVASHFGMTPKVARRTLLEMELAGRIIPCGPYIWKVEDQP